MSALLTVFIIAAALFCEAFFAGSETGIISTNRIKLFYRANKGDKRAIIIKHFLNNPESFLGTTLVGVNLSVIIGSSVASELVMKSLNRPDYAPLVTTLIMLPLILIFGEIIPKAIFRRYADTIALWSAYPLRIVSIALFPLVWIATRLASFTSIIFASDKIKKNPYVSREEMRLLLQESSKQGLLTKEELSMAYEIFDFGRTDVRSVMVPLKSVVSTSDQSKESDITELIAKSGFSRIPIYKDDPENIIGTIQVSDLIKESAEYGDIQSVIREPYKVHEDMPIDELLREFQNNRKKIAIVVNKQDQAVGISTLEDVIEEIVGEIEDEYDTGSKNIPTIEASPR